MALPKEEVFGTFTAKDGTYIELNREGCNTVRQALGLQVIEGGLAAENDRDPLISTGKAAELIGVSRRTVVRALDAGAMTYERYGAGHRKIRLSEVMRYKEESIRRKAALSQMRRDAYEGGMDDLDMIDDYLKQFDEPGEEDRPLTREEIHALIFGEGSNSGQEA